MTNSTIALKHITAIDVETVLISEEHPVPEVICMSAAHQVFHDSRTVATDQFVPDFINLISDTSHYIVGHNIAFDLSVLCYQYPELWAPVFKAYDEGRIHDTLLRERLLNLTLYGNFEVAYDGGRPTKIYGYSLHQLEKKYLGIDREELKTSPDSPRFNFESLRGLPAKDWPEDAYKYSVDDSVNCLAIYYAQEEERGRIIHERELDPFTVEAFRCRVSFALRLLECKGSRLDPEKVIEVTKEFMDLYNDPNLTEPLIEAGLIIPGSPPMPHANGAKEHIETCIHNKKHDDYKAGRKIKCECPPKMTKEGKKETMPTKVLYQYLWATAYQLEGDIKIWPALKATYEKKTLDGRAFSQDYIESTIGILPPGLTIQTDEEWFTTYGDKDPLLKLYAQRKALRKIVTDYLPKFYSKDGTPAEILRGSFFPLMKTGRSSCRAAKIKKNSKEVLFPSGNQQNVDPRVRPCTIAREGNILISTDYSGMELATLAQKCINLFGHSVLADKINNGDDTHAYLASQIAVHMEPGFKWALGRMGSNGKAVDLDDHEAVFQAFMKCKGSEMSCVRTIPKSVDAIKSQYLADKGKKHNEVVTWGEFFKYYRTFAKPVGLGYPGGLGPNTMVEFAKGTYKVDLTKELAYQLREIWMETYPEMVMYLLQVKNHCRDPFHKAHYVVEDGTKRLRQYYCYDTPLGMHRARCGFCDCANGMGLQAPSAEGALDALYQVQVHCNLAIKGELLWKCFPINFVHDEIIWECPDDGFVDVRVALVDKIMVDSMEKITPDVKARTESVAMRRWYKEAEAVYDDNGKLIPWEPSE